MSHPAPPFSIESYQQHQPNHRQAFYDLNIAWLRKYFVVEPIDEIVLGDPEGKILASGGAVFIAVQANRAIGAVALKSSGEGRYELTKLAVDPSVQQGGIGRALCEAVIDCFLAKKGKTLFLETNTVLEPAIRLYQRLHFVAMAPPQPSPYSRSNYYMQWDRAAAGR